ncbi:MAG: N-acetyltransferase [Brooklawnia sp.]|nr:N-acetyltransferase [Brooklawnia sp.]
MRKSGEAEITNNPGRSRYEARLDGQLAGFAEYELGDGLITFTHTLVRPVFEGRGVGAALVRAALDDVRAAGTRKVTTSCPFFRGWLERHPEYHDLCR